jgi:hypothetical protein
VVATGKKIERRETTHNNNNNYDKTKTKNKT